MIYDVIIVGAGASGLMCAVELEKSNMKYLLVEKNSIAGKKILISGGSRCNVTNNLEIEEFISTLTLKNKKFLYPAMYTLGPANVINFFKENDLELVLENNFKYFPITNKSQSVIDVLLKNINQKNINYNTKVKSITMKDTLFNVKTEKSIYKSRNIVIATGSKSFPKTGSTGYGIKVAKYFDIEYQDFSPAETHIYSNQIVKNYPDLQGTAIKNTTVYIKGTNISYQGDLLFTHFGLSGPAIYHLSEFIAERSNNVEIVFSLTGKDSTELTDIFRQSNMFILKILEQCVSKRVAKKILQVSQIENKKVGEISKKNIQHIMELLTKFTVRVTKVEDKEKAYVNKGGILLSELNPATMETRKVKGLHFVGETVNIHGPIGGYNITIAFATGVLAALNIIEKKEN